MITVCETPTSGETELYLKLVYSREEAFYCRVCNFIIETLKSKNVLLAIIF